MRATASACGVGRRVAVALGLCTLLLHPAELTAMRMGFTGLVPSNPRSFTCLPRRLQEVVLPVVGAVELF